MKTKLLITITLMVFLFMSMNAQVKTYTQKNLGKFIIENSKTTDVKFFNREVIINVDVESGTIQIIGETEKMYKITMVESKESDVGNIKVKSQNGMEMDFDMLARGIDGDNNKCMISRADYPLENRTCLQVQYEKYVDKYTIESRPTPPKLPDSEK